MDSLTVSILRHRWDRARSLLSPPSAFKANRSHVMGAARQANIPPDIVSLLLKRADMGDLFPSADGAQKAEGETPLHNAARFGTASTVRVILDVLKRRAGDEALRLTYAKLTALDCAWSTFLYFREKSSEERWQELEHIACFDDMLRGQRFADLRELWNKTTFLMLAADRGELDHPLSDGRQWQIVHVIARNAGGRCYFDTNALQTFCPTVVMLTALQLYPHQVRQRDERGRLPLHIAASNPVHHALQNEDVAEESEFARQSRKSVAQMLVERYPNGAKMADRNGRLPLNIAIESYDRWSTIAQIREIEFATIKDYYPRQHSHKLHSHKLYWDSTIIALMEAAPDALITRDTKTHLYPFMLAATVRSAPLDIVFKLLRADPSVVKGGIRQTHHEQYLETKVHALKRERDAHLTELSELKAKVARLEGSPMDVRKLR